MFLRTSFFFPFFMRIPLFFLQRIFFGLSVFLLSAPAFAATEKVYPSDMATSFAEVASDSTKWFFYNDEIDAIDNTLGSFVTGPGTPPLSSAGSVNIDVTGTQRRNLSTYQFSGVPLADITELKYSTYNPSTGNGGSTDRAGYLNFNVDFDGSNTWQKRLVFVPRNNGTVLQDTWQEWNALDNGSGYGSALWSYSGATWPAQNAADAGTTLKTWTEIITDYPSVRVRVTDSWFGVRVGEPYNDGYTENIDAFVFGTAAGSTTWDFEPSPSHLTLEKEVVNDNDGTSADTDWTLTATGPVPISGIEGDSAVTSAPVDPGTYTLSESGPSGYTASDWVCNEVNGAPVAVANGNKVDITSGQDIVCTITNNDNKHQFTVTVVKYIDGVEATAVSANNSAFPMTSSWNATNIGAGSGSYALGTVGFNNPNPYRATTSLMEEGASYTTAEDTDGVAVSGDSNLVGNNCADGYPFALTGYTQGDSVLTAEGETPTLTPPAFNNLTEDSVVIVWNETCKTGLTVIKEVVDGDAVSSDFTIEVSDGGGVIESDTGIANPGRTYNVSAGNYVVHETNPGQYETTYGGDCDVDGNVTVTNGETSVCTIINTLIPETSSYMVTVIKYLDGSLAAEGSFPIKEIGGGSYVLDDQNGYTYTISVEQGEKYRIRELLKKKGDVGRSCEEGKPYALVGYTTGNTLGEAENNTPSSKIPRLRNISEDKVIIVWNETCEQCDEGRIKELEKEIRQLKWQYLKDIRECRHGNRYQQWECVDEVKKEYKKDVKDLENELQEEENKCDEHHHDHDDGHDHDDHKGH